MNDPARPGLRPLSHLKAGPTTSSSSSTALPAPPDLQPSSQTQTPQRPVRRTRNTARDDQLSALSDKATAALIRRVLCPQSASYGSAAAQAPEELLPPLTSSNDVDRQLYAILAIIVKEFVFSWYSKVTSDQMLVQEIIQVIAHCTRALEQRLRATDVAQLILDEIPALVETHIISYRLAKEQSSLSGLEPSVREIYHSLNPHPALSPIPNPDSRDSLAQQCENEAAYRQLLTHGVLAVLLPTEELQNACLRTLVADILADLILGNEVAGRMCDGLFLWESITKAIDGVRQRDSRQDDTAITRNSQLQKFGLLSPREEFVRARPSPKAQLRFPTVIWDFLQFVYLAYVTLRFIAAGLFRVAFTDPATSSSKQTSSQVNEMQYGTAAKRPVLDYRLYGMLVQLVDIPRRMPWLGGMLALLQYLILAGPGRLGDTDSVVDRFLHETISDYILTPTFLPNVLVATRAALFPSNARPTTAQTRAAQAAAAAPATPDEPAVSLSVRPPTPPAQCGTGATASEPTATAPDRLSHVASVKRLCAARLLSLFPPSLARRFFGLPDADAPDTSPNAGSGSGPDDTVLLEAVESHILDLFEDQYCNKHLVFSILEAVLGKLLPEMAEHSITELMEHRGVSF